MCLDCPPDCDVCVEEDLKPLCMVCSNGFILDSTGKNCVIYCK